MRLFSEPATAREPRAQGDGSPEPVYTADLPELIVQLRGNVDRPFAYGLTDDSDATEVGYGHGV